MNTQDKTGILLLNLGGPETLADVQPFLYNLFSDREIIRLGPALLQKALALIIARRRAPQSRANYKRIGGGSPIRARTEAQARALEAALRDDGAYLVRACMRYWHPRADVVLRELIAAGVRSLVALPLYPHYSKATTGSSLTDLRQALTQSSQNLPLSIIPSWPDTPRYIHRLAERIREGLAHWQGAPVVLLYSAHSLPVQFIQEGDPYVDHLERTIRAVEEQTGIPGRLCYQSRSGPVAWLGPSLPEVIRELAAGPIRNLLVVPISFVSDHVETLYEIDIQYRELAGELGLRLESTRALNDDPGFIAALRDLVLARPEPAAAS